MTGCWLMAGVTFREAARKRILWTALGAVVALLGIFGAGLHYQIAEFTTRSTPQFVRSQILSAMLMIGLYTVDLLAVVMTILTSVDTISGEIASGTIDAIATKPVARWELFFGKWIGFAAMIAVYVALAFGGTLAMGRWFAGVTLQHPLEGALLILFECLLALTVTFACGTWFSTLTNGVLVIGLQGCAFMGGWLEQMSGFTESDRLAQVGILSSLIMPGEAMWRRAAFEMQPPLAAALPFSPFSDVSIPSAAMIGYAGVYLVVVFGVALAHFYHRDL